jgi:hypothetical protein
MWEIMTVHLFRNASVIFYAAVKCYLSLEELGDQCNVAFALCRVTARISCDTLPNAGSIISVTNFAKDDIGSISTMYTSKGPQQLN